MIHNLRWFNTNCIEEAIKRKKGSKVFAGNLSIGQSQLTKLKTENGNIIASKPEILREIERFYRQLYTSSQEPVSRLANDLRANLTRHYT